MGKNEMEDLRQIERHSPFPKPPARYDSILILGFPSQTESVEPTFPLDGLFHAPIRPDSIPIKPFSKIYKIEEE